MQKLLHVYSHGHAVMFFTSTIWKSSVLEFCVHGQFSIYCMLTPSVGDHLLLCSHEPYILITLYMHQYTQHLLTMHVLCTLSTTTVIITHTLSIPATTGQHHQHMVLVPYNLACTHWHETHWHCQAGIKSLSSGTGAGKLPAFGMLSC